MSSRGPRMVLTYLFFGWLLLVVGPESRAQSVHLDGRGGDADWGETPVVVAVRAPLSLGGYVLEGGRQGSRIPAVVFEDGDRRWFAAILPAVPARQPFTYDLKPVPSAGTPSRDGIRFVPITRDVSDSNVRGLDVTFDGTTLTEYRPMSGSKPILFPMIGPTGEPFTRAYPMLDVPGEDRDHPHQRSFWFTHGSVNGVDFWAEDREGTPAAKKTKGTIREQDRQVIVEGPVLARLRTRDDWLAPDGRRVCRDRRTVTFYHTQAVRIIDFEIAVEATDGPLTFGDTKEGMFGLRVASSMDVKRKNGGKITNAEGLTDDKAWGKASPWVDYVGPVKEQTVGIAILNHPSSFRFPTTWHVRDYGLFAANPFGWKDFGRAEHGDYTLPAGETIRFAYRVILHKGDTASFGPNGYFQAYAQPDWIVR
jgi:Methane oxygenase PmoA